MFCLGTFARHQTPSRITTTSMHPYADLACGAIVCLALLTFKDMNINYIMMVTSLYGAYAYLATRGGGGKTARSIARLFFGLWVPGLVYGVCIHLGSNQHAICFSHAMTLSAIASLVMIAAKVRADSASMPSRLWRIGMALCIVLPIAMLGWMRYERAFWDAPMSEMEATIGLGPQHGITISKRIYDIYMQSYSEVRSLRTRQPDGPILCFSRATWLYLLFEEKMGTYSAWQGGVDQHAVDRLRAYWQLNKHKRPILIINDEPQLTNALCEALGQTPTETRLLDSGRWLLIF